MIFEAQFFCFQKKIFWMNNANILFLQCGFIIVFCVVFPSSSSITAPNSLSTTTSTTISPPIRASYFSIPKTASTTARAIIKTSPCFSKHISAVQHRNCNGSNPRYNDLNSKSITTIREPCSHFISMFHHLQHQEIRQDHVYFDKLNNIYDLLQWVKDIKTKCHRNLLQDDNKYNFSDQISQLELFDYHDKVVQLDNCIVHEMQKAESDHRASHSPVLGTKQTHIQIPLWPQSFYISNFTHLICYDSEKFERRLINVFNDVLHCKTIFNHNLSTQVLKTSIEKKIDENENILGDIRRNKHKTDISHRFHVTNSNISSPVGKVKENKQVQEAIGSATEEQGRVCEAIQNVYYQDTVIWNQRCAICDDITDDGRCDHEGNIFKD